MTQTSKLKASSRNILDELLAQLEKRLEVMRGLEATVITRDLVYRRGTFVVTDTHTEQLVLTDEKSLQQLDDTCEVFTSPVYRLEELSSDRRDAIRIRALPARPGKFNITNPKPEDHQAAIAVIRRAPVQLLEMKLLIVNLPWWLDLALKSFESKVEFEYVRGVPLPRKGFSRGQSRGIGSWRFGGGTEVEVMYHE